MSAQGGACCCVCITCNDAFYFIRANVQKKADCSKRILCLCRALGKKSENAHHSARSRRVCLWQPPYFLK